MDTKREYYMTDDGSVVTRDGNVAYFSTERFKRDICAGECCFICGVHPGAADFNDEHVIPDWILRELNMHARRITLANGQTFRYDRYKVPCCAQCNSMLGERVEEPVSAIIKGGMPAVVAHLRQHGPWLLYIWLSLLFLKTHLRDRGFRWHLDARQGTFPISEAYDWEELHHIHCVARAFFTQAELDAKALGSFFALPALFDGPFEHFDYADLYFHRAICFRFRDVALVSVLNDSCACFSLEKDKLFSRIAGPLSPLQIREVMARMGYLNLLIRNRPTFHSEFKNGEYKISGSHPDTVEVDDWDADAYGQALYFACRGLLQRCFNADLDVIAEHLRHGRYTFLFDENGEFITREMRSEPPSRA